MGDVSWHFLLVNCGIEHIRIVNDGTIKFEGRVPAGFSRHLVIGDSVMIKAPKAKWQTKFRLVIKDGRPALRFGTVYGNPMQYVYLDKFTRAT